MCSKVKTSISYNISYYFRPQKKRTKMSFFASIIVPPIFILVCLLFTLLIPELDESVPMDLDYTMFETTNNLRSNRISSFIIQDQEGDKYDSIVDALKSKPGFGTWCSDSNRIKEKKMETINWANEKGMDFSARYCNEEFLDINEESWYEIGDRTGLTN